MMGSLIITYRYLPAYVFCQVYSEGGPGAWHHSYYLLTLQNSLNKKSTNMKMLILVLAVTIMTACTNNPSAEANNSKETVMNLPTDDPNDIDHNFVSKAASGGMMEVELGKVAQQNAQNQRVKNFGAMMVRDHSKANQELISIASGKNYNIPASMNTEHQNMMEDMKKMSGAAFDEHYMNMMVSDHNKDIEEFRKQANQGNDAGIKAFASKTLPVLETHLDSAKAIYQDVKGGESSRGKM
jgi:putative membrane protein